MILNKLKKTLLTLCLGTLLASKLLADTIPILSGTDGNGNPGIPGNSDPLVTFTSENVSNETNAYIGVGAQNNPSLTMDRIGTSASQTITTTNTFDSWGKFYAQFNLPNNFSNPNINLDLFLDDGGIVYLNDNSVKMINLVDCPTSISIDNSSLFKTGTNTLTFYVVNTGNSYYGISRPRQSSGDAMYIEFDGNVTFDAPDEIKSYPILLVPGYILSGNSLTSFGDLERILKQDGFNVEPVDLSSYLHSDSIEELSNVVIAEISKAKSKYGSSKINVVAHSMGGLDTKAYISNMASSSPYRNDIEYFIMFGTPTYGCDLATLISFNNKQAEEMSPASMFLWDLHHAWINSNFNSSKCIAVAGNYIGEGDGVVNISSAYSPNAQMRYIPYFHNELVNVDNRNHLTYKIIKSVLKDGSLISQIDLTGSNPSFSNSSMMLGALDGTRILTDAFCESAVIQKNEISGLFYLYDLPLGRVDYILGADRYENLYTSSSLVKGQTVVVKKYLERVDSNDDSGSGGGGGGGCFIATAVYGTNAKEVRILSDLRDKQLLTNPLGKTLVKAYYKTSPDIADYIKDKEKIKSVIKYFLKPILFFANEKSRI